MAEEKRSINIAYKADLKDLIAKLKQMPNVTEAEAKKMVAALDRQLKQAEKASKQAADASKKAAREAANAASRGAKDFDDLADSARRAEERLERVAESSGDIDRGFSSVGLALRGVNPQVAEAADGLADMFAVVEGLTMSVTALNPVVVAAGVAIGALTLGYVAHQAELEKARQLTLELKDAQEALATSQLEQEDNLVDAGAKLRDLQRDYKLLTGQITQYEYDLEKAGEAAEVAFLGNIKFAKEAAKEASNNVKMVNALLSNYTKVGKLALSDSEIERLRLLQLQNDQINNSLDLTSKQKGVHEALFILQKSVTAEAAEQNLNVKKVTLAQEEAIRLAREMVTMENELAKATEEAEKQTNKKVEASKKIIPIKEDELDLIQQQIEAENRFFDRQIEANQRLEDAQIESFMNAQDRDKQKELRDALAFGRKIEEIEELGRIAEEEELAQDIIAQMMHNNELKRIEELKEKREEAAKENLESLMEFGNVATQLGENLIKNSQLEIDMSDKKREELAKMSDIERDAYEKKRKQLRALFTFQKGMSMAEVAMKTAEAIIAAQKLIPPFNFIQAGIATGIGAAQLGVVMSQQMPSFHMGGLAQDESTARVLKGEAVLDRATVRRIGGEQGVRNLQQGGSNGSQTVVIQPFKHFGRFAKDLGISSPKLQGIRGY